MTSDEAVGIVALVRENTAVDVGDIIEELSDVKFIRLLDVCLST
jgi:hypothetical protein